MTDALAADRFLATMRQARREGDLDKLAGLFDEEASFAIVGMGEPVVGKAALRAALQSLIDTYAFVEWEPIAVVASGGSIAARHRLEVCHRASGRVVRTETSEFLSLRDGKCEAFTQFVDTALVHSLTAGP